MKYPIGIQDFESLRKDGYVYVDKTALMYRLLSTGKYYFLSRPRRFGKSLLLTTFEAYFRGKRELFEGLAVERLEKDWTRHPVLHLDLTVQDYSRPEALEERLDLTLTQWEKVYGTESKELSPQARLEGIVRRACEQTGQGVVILVDEYDKPLLETLDNEELHDKFRSQLRAFYSVLKAQDRYIRFAFLTGVTRFSRLSVFSDLNNLNDVSMDDDYAEICGITEKELHSCFDESIRELARLRKMTYDEACAKLREQYDGYHFAKCGAAMYNPFSVISSLAKHDFDSYWFETGTPSFLLRMLRDKDYDLRDLDGAQASPERLKGVESFKTSPVAILYQSGYLTIKDYDPGLNEYSLCFPNREVEEGFTKALLPLYVDVNRGRGDFISSFYKEVRSGNPEGFLGLLKTLFDDSDYRIAGELELYFQNSMSLVFRVLGFITQVERATSRGRMDVVVQTGDYVYVMELKVDTPAEAALRQIDEKGYMLPFSADGRKLFKIGVCFSSETRSLGEWQIAEAKDC
ncbi:MAG: ATP-binding protein [Prevotellaceae bacterium]|nr:ATP-binding protein [Prevotellaceae bacterium]